MRKNKNKELIEYLLIFFLFEPTIFVKSNILNYTFVLLSCVSFINIIIITFKSKYINYITIELIIIRIIYIGMTLIFKGDILKVGYQSIVFIALLLYAYYFYKNNKFDKFIMKIKNIFGLYLVINLVTYIICPEGIGNESRMFFLGYRTRFTEYAIVMILLSILSYNLNLITKKCLIFELIICFLNIFLPTISTAIVGIIILFVTYLISLRIKNINYRVLFIVGILMNLLIVFFRIQNVFSFIIEQILKKSLTLTNRTQIWDASYKYIFDKNFFIGHGYPIDGNFIYTFGTFWQSHNQILQMLYEVGLFGTILFNDILLKSLKEIETPNANLKKKYFAWIGSTFVAFSIMMITEIYSYYMPFYVLIILALYFKGILINLEGNKIDDK